MHPPLQARPNCNTILYIYQLPVQRKLTKSATCVCSCFGGKAEKGLSALSGGVHSRATGTQPCQREVLTSSLPLGWALLAGDTLLSQALILDLLACGVF